MPVFRQVSNLKSVASGVTRGGSTPQSYQDDMTALFGTTRPVEKSRLSRFGSDLRADAGIYVPGHL